MQVPNDNAFIIKKLVKSNKNVSLKKSINFGKVILEGYLKFHVSYLSMAHKEAYLCSNCTVLIYQHIVKRMQFLPVLLCCCINCFILTKQSCAG